MSGKNKYVQMIFNINDSDNAYTKMQQRQYDLEAANWSVQNRDPVVGSFDAHNAWSDYDNFLFKGIATTDKLALDFACGPGRNIVKFNSQFQRIDGADISDFNLKNAIKWCEYNEVSTPNLYKTNGYNLQEIKNEIYDVVFSTIAMQHICVYDIRYGLMSEFFRVLKPGGMVCIQMGYGNGHPSTVGYYENKYDATLTNSGLDTRVNSPDELRTDLEAIGFKSFDYDIRPTGPGDSHENWIFFRATK